MGMDIRRVVQVRKSVTISTSQKSEEHKSFEMKTRAVILTSSNIREMSVRKLPLQKVPNMRNFLLQTRNPNSKQNLPAGLGGV